MHQVLAPPAADAAAPVRVSPWPARVAGGIAGLSGLAVADLAAWVIAPNASTVPAVGNRIIDALPAALVNWGKDTLGVADKPVLLALIVAAVLALGALAGQWEYHRRRAGLAVFAGLALIGLTALILSPGVPPAGYLTILIGLTAGYLILTILIEWLRRWRRATADREPAEVDRSRRRFVIAATVAGVGAAAVGVTSRVLLRAAGAVAEARAKFRLPAAASSALPLSAGTDLRLPDLAPYVSPNDNFYRIDTALQVPTINPDQWTLTITGLVEREVSITLAELAARPLVEHHITLTGVSNAVGGHLADNALWLGYPIRDLLAEAGVAPEADMVLSRSVDGWTAGTPLEALTDPDRQALLAIGMNGEPLPLEHGYPVRMVVPGLYGYVSATKWVTELKVTTFAADQGYWTPLGWSALGPIKIASRIDVPGDGVATAGTVTVAGVAWAQHTGIRAVEVRVDDGPWRPAQLAETAGPDTWRQWSLTWAATPGEHTLSVRATDANGQVQTDAVAEPEPDGATGHHTIAVRVS